MLHATAPPLAAGLDAEVTIDTAAAPMRFDRMIFGQFSGFTDLGGELPDYINDVAGASRAAPRSRDVSIAAGIVELPPNSPAIPESDA